ncbi:MAG: nucleotide pyrophosphohydrolase [Burkholderiaceae bacterium]
MTTENAQDPQPRLIDVDALALALEKFASDRDWAQFHSPKNLVMALTGEVGELSELFQWMPQEQSLHAARDPRLAEPLRDELADVLLYLVRLASVLGVDLNEAATQKLKKNAAKYPVAAAYGSSAKYTEL